MRLTLKQKNNLLLAHFLDWKLNGIGCFGHVQNIGRELYNPITTNTRSSHPIHLAFDESWDWAMIVLDAIERLGYNTTITKFEDQFMCAINDGITPYKGFNAKIPKGAVSARKLSAVYGAAVEFVTWYYKQTDRKVNYQLK